MILDQRGFAILNRVIHASSYVSPLKLVGECKVSKRTIYDDVEKINSWLRENSLEPLSYAQSKGFYVSEAGKLRIKEKLYYEAKKLRLDFSPEERIGWLAVLILTRENELFLDDLMENLPVGRRTLVNDLKQLKGKLPQFHLALEYHKKTGYSIAGDEQSKRKALVYFLTTVLSNRDWSQLLAEIRRSASQKSLVHTPIFRHCDLDLIYEIIHEAELFTKVHFSEEIIQTLSVHLFLLIKRFTKGKESYLDPIEKLVIQEAEEYPAASYICSQVKDSFHIEMGDDEVYYVAAYLLGVKIGDFNPNNLEVEHLADLKQMITNMVDDFQKYACVLFKNRRELEQDLFFHLKPTYFRMKYGIELDNPLTETMHTAFRDLYQLTEKVVHHFEYILGKRIPGEEIAYIAVHFGGWMEKEGLQAMARKKAVIVSDSGTDTCRFLKKQIEDLVSGVDITEIMSMKHYEKAPLTDIQHIFATIPIKTKGIPVFEVQPILNNQQKAALLNWLCEDGSKIPVTT